MRSLLQAILAPTPQVHPRNLRTYQLFAIGPLAAVLIHAAILVLFSIIGVRELALVNVGSVVLYVSIFALNRRGWHMATAVLAAAELVLHQVACVHFIGLDAGFQHYLLIAATVPFFLPSGRDLTKLLVLAGCAGTFLALIFTSGAPVHSLNPTLEAVLASVNIATVFSLLGLFAWTYVRAAEDAEDRAEAQHQRVVDLLHNILPVSIARRLEERPGIIADRFDDASILFADIVGFTPLAERTDPRELVAMLDAVFSALDDLVVAHGLEKIKTIGDAYMVASGVPETRPDHTRHLAAFAIDALEVVRTHFAGNDPVVQLRVGLHRGPVVAGVIGKKRLLYDLWGDTVNTAARMESHGLPGAIQVSAAAHEVLQDHFVLEPRGAIAVKGKGTMETWLLMGRATGSEPTLAAEGPRG
jgi:adenylate cyclase